MCAGYAQGNLVVLPKDLAYDFLLFTQRNPKSCPILEVSDTGSRYFRTIADCADIAKDIPKYRIYRNGVLDGEYTDVSEFWQDDFVSFLIGCSFSFEAALLEANVPVRHIEEGFATFPCTRRIFPVSRQAFSRKYGVSMRPIPHDLIPRAVLITGEMPRVHGAPVHIGAPEAIGIQDINKPDFGEMVTIRDGEVPVFWPCGSNSPECCDGIQTFHCHHSCAGVI